MQVGTNLDGRMKTKSNIIVTLAESLKTLEMLKHPFQSLTNLSRGGRTISAIIKGSSSAYLEYRYGWRQLYTDIREFANVYERARSHIKYLREHVETGRKISASQQDTLNPDTLYPHAVNGATITFKATEQSRVARFSLISPVTQAMLQVTQLETVLQGLGTDLVFEAMWDLVPYSFIVDWFFNVQKWVMLNPLLYQMDKVKYMGYSTKTKWTYTASCDVAVGPTWDGLTDTASWTSAAQVLKEEYTRNPGFPPGSSGPASFDGLSTTQLADSAALILQRI
jgi:hypothetical protein